MNQDLISSSHADLVWKEELPVLFKGVHLPGSSVLSSVDAFGSVCIQEFATDNFSIRFNVFELLQRFVVKSFSYKSGKRISIGNPQLMISITRPNNFSDK